MSRVRVLRVIARMNVGGPAVQVTSLHRGLDPSAYELLLLTGAVDEGEADHLELRAPDVQARRVSGLGRSVRAGDDLRAVRELRAVVRDFAPDIVHTHTAKAGVLGRLAAWTGGSAATVHTFHGHLLHGYFNPVVTGAVRLTEAALARRTTRLVAVGRQVRDDLLAAGIGRPEQFTVVPPGVSLPPVPPRAEARAALGLPHDALVVSFVARLTQIKRPDRVIEVARRLADRGDVVFAVVGEGPLLPELRHAAAELPNVRLLGWRSDVETVYGASDLTLLTSDNEGMPVALIEAALCGVPAVTTDVGSASEVVLHERSGLVVAAEAEALDGAIRVMLDDEPMRRSMASAARSHAEANYSAARLVADTDRLYRSVLEAKEHS